MERVLAILCSLLVTKNIAGPYGHVEDENIALATENNEQKLGVPNYEYEDWSGLNQTTMQDYMVEETNKVYDESEYIKELKQENHGIEINKYGKVDSVAQVYFIYAEDTYPEYDTEYIDKKNFDNDDENYTEDDYGDGEKYYREYDGEEGDTTVNSELLQPGVGGLQRGYSVADPT